MDSRVNSQLYIISILYLPFVVVFLYFTYVRSSIAQTRQWASLSTVCSINGFCFPDWR